MAAGLRDVLPGGTSTARLGLAAFVLAWLFDLVGLRALLPIWLPFLVALGLELHFFLVPGSARSAARPDRGPQPVDRERYGYAEQPEELLVVREGERELWLPYSGEAGEELDALLEEAGEREQAAPAPAPPRETPPPARPVRQLLAGLAVIGALAAVVAFAGGRGWDAVDGDRRAEAERLFSAEAGRIVGRPVTVDCDESGTFVGAVQHADGVAALGGRVAYLTPERCLDLYRLAFEGEVLGSRTARAIAVLAHEAWHLRGVRDEGTTECYALQSGVELGRRLGLSEGRARQLMRQQLVENSLRRGRSVEYRVPPECRDGGRLDLDRSGSQFP